MPIFCAFLQETFALFTQSAGYKLLACPIFFPGRGSPVDISHKYQTEAVNCECDSSARPSPTSAMHGNSDAQPRGGEHEKLVPLHVQKTPLVSVAKRDAPPVLFVIDFPHVCSCSCYPLNDVAVTALKNLAYASIWIALSASVILFNKYILAFGGFPFPISLTVWHMLFSSSIASTLVWTGRVPSTEGMDARKCASAVLPIGALFAGTLWLGNAAYLHLSVSFIQMLKALMPAAVYGVGCLFSTETFAWKCVLNMLIITFGVALASAGELALPRSPENAPRPLEHAPSLP
jgi:hypothetical protein